MILHPPPGTRVKTGPNPSEADPPPPIKHGHSVSFLGAFVQVRWNDGTETCILGQYLDPDE
jgi:hypothetical protein